jgi:hypothetical protein
LFTIGVAWSLKSILKDIQWISIVSHLGGGRRRRCSVRGGRVNKKGSYKREKMKMKLVEDRAGIKPKDE